MRKTLKTAVAFMLLLTLVLSTTTSLAATAKTPAPIVGLGVVGKITVPGTKINYNIAVATDNVYYMTRDENGKKSSNGAIFMDYRNRDTNRRKNIILYGHNMKSGAMFAAIHNMKTNAGLEKYKKVNLTLYKTNYEYEIYKVAIVDVSKDNYTRSLFKDEADYAAYIQKLNDLPAQSSTGYVPTSKDQILTLVTCTKPTDKNGRLLAFAYKK